jgi:hypothetical protein
MSHLFFPLPFFRPNVFSLASSRKTAVA